MLQFWRLESKMKLTELKSKVFLLEALGEILFPHLFQIVKVTCDFCLMTLSSVFSVSSWDLSPAPPCSLSSSLHLLLWLFLGPLWLHWVYLDNSGWNYLSVLNLNTPESLFCHGREHIYRFQGLEHGYL